MSIARDMVAYVTHAADLDVVIHVEEAAERRRLAELGFVELTTGVMERTSSNIEEKARTFCLLRDMGIAFSSGRGWSPSEVFEELRDRKLLDGTYQRISWVAPGQSRIESDC